jgi:hypothetical protein
VGVTNDDRPSVGCDADIGPNLANLTYFAGLTAEDLRGVEHDNAPH